MQRRSTSRLNALLLASVIAVTPLAMPGVSVTSGQAQAQGLDMLFNTMKRDIFQGGDKRRPAERRGNNKNQNNNGGVGMGGILQGVGAGLLMGGLISGDAGPVIAGTILMAAPVVVQKDMERKYGKDQSWAGCVSCNQRRLLVRPGSGISTAQQNEAKARIRADVRDMQGALAQLGFYTQKIDGDFGPGTRKAIGAFQQSIDAEATGKLSAEQRRELFAQADGKGFAPQSEPGKAALMAVAATAGAATTAASAVPSIKEFKLAESQTSRLASDVLQFGGLSQVKKVSLLPDGRLELEVEDGSTPGSPLILQAGAETIAIDQHELSDSWLQVTMLNTGTGKPVTLNTIDTFKTTEEAVAWRQSADQRIDLLEKLTERQTQPLLVAEADKVEVPASAGAAETDDAANAAPATIQPAVDAGTPGQPVLAGADPALPAAPETEGQVVKAALTGTADAAVAATAAKPGACGNDVYVSFNFPKPDNPINHYNITPPAGTLVMDNGDSTAYFTGACVQGKYGYKYVVVTHDEKKKTYGSYVREGSFEIASVAGQCEVDLNSPDGSATLRCY